MGAAALYAALSRGTGASMKYFRVLSLLVLLVAASSLPAAESKPVKPTPKDKCPVCGMFVFKYPDFLAEILFKDGTYAVFDGTKDLFKYYFNVKKYHPSKSISDMASVHVTDYYSLELTDGLGAFYVLGSDVYGPMGRELIPFQKESDAKEFLKDHKGERLLKFREVTPEMVMSLD